MNKKLLVSITGGISTAVLCLAFNSPHFTVN